MCDFMKKKSLLYSKFITLLLDKGKKNKIELVLLKTIKELQKVTKKQVLNVIKAVILKNYSVVMIKKPKTQKFQRKNLKKVLIPYLLKAPYRILSSLKTILWVAKQKSNQNFFLALKNEILISFNKLTTNPTIQSDLYRLVFLKKNFAHYRWFL